MKELLSKMQISAQQHRNKDVIMLKFGYNPSIINEVKKLTGATFSKTHKAWYVIDNLYYRNLFEIKPKQLVDEIGKKQLSIENEQALKKYVQCLQQKGYSPNTVRTYYAEFYKLLEILKAVNINSLTSERLNDYFHYCISKLNLSENQMHSRINAVKFYFEKVIEQEDIAIKIIRPKKQKILPKALSLQDVMKVLNAVNNNKHYLILALCYGTGIRISEIVNIKLCQIDSNRKTIFIERAKGKKDRYVNLPASLIAFIEIYKQEFKPIEYLFEGQYGGQYHVRSVQQIFTDAKTKAGIKTHGGIHTFRHSYATHLLESGTDISLIQKLLGHNDIKTTLIYAQVSQKELSKVVSPLDALLRNKPNL